MSQVDDRQLKVCLLNKHIREVSAHGHNRGSDRRLRYVRALGVSYERRWFSSRKSILETTKKVFERERPALLGPHAKEVH